MKKKVSYKFRMGFHSFKLLSKDIKAFAKKNNNMKNRKVKTMRNITLITDNYPGNG